MGLFDASTESAKMLLIGDQGHGKTGAKAALIAAGYKLRMIDVDRGSKILRSLLTDPHYPYAAYMKKHGIDPREPGRISCIPINVPMDVTNTTVRRDGRNMSYDILAPTSARPWAQVLDLMKNWKDGDLNLGAITDWDNDTIFDIDTLSTLAELAKYWNQALNNRLGALEDDHGRDTGAAQELVSRLAIKLTNPEVRCNVIITTHRTWIDMERGAPLSPEQLLREKKSVEARGYPTIIGRALSPFLGKRWNDQVIVQQSDRGERKIHTEMTDNTAAKHSVWLEPTYPLSSGLAEIFAALQFKSLPEDFIPSIRGKDKDSSDKAAEPGRSSGFGSSGFGR
jgi:hypothetical protein